MAEVIPALNVHLGDTADLEAKLARVVPFATVVHLDVADGVFTPNKTWNDPEHWQQVTHAGDVTLEVHLMVAYPEQVLDAWLDAGAKRIIVHLESLLPQATRFTEDDPRTLITKMRDACVSRGAELAIAVLPETGSALLAAHGDLVTSFLALAVHPGYSGQPFLPIVLSTVRELRHRFPGAHVAVDGGITKETGMQAVQAGADRLVSATYIVDSEHPQESFTALQSL